jgi:hypothetical protein
MPVPGGVSDKFGNRFEGRWTVLNMAMVLGETANSIWLEPWDDSGEGIEFTLRSAQGDSHHQVKRQVSGSVQWTIKRLDQVEVLASAKAHLAEPAATFAFVSTSPSMLHSLVETANTSDSYEGFRGQLNKEDDQSFRDLVARWDPWTEEQAYGALRRIEAPIIDEATLIKMVRGNVASLVEGDPDSVVDFLAAYALDHLTQDIGASALWAHLKGRGHEPRDWWRNESVVHRFAEQRQRVLIETARSLIAGVVIPRDIVEELTTILTSDQSGQLVVVVGDAGTGKTVVLAELVTRVGAAGMEVLPLRVDRLTAAGFAAPQTAADIGERLHLPASPAAVLANLARGRRAVLVVDQLDAVSLLSGRNPAAFEAIDEVIRQALDHPNVSVLVACRRYDLENDPRLRSLRQAPNARVCDVGRFTPEQVSATLAQNGVDASTFNQRQLDLMRNALNLRLFLESGGGPGGWFETRKDLFDKYWPEKRRRTTERLGRDARWTEVVDWMTAEIDRTRSLSVPFTILDPWEHDAEAMVSEGVLVRDDELVAFTHQAFFDYAFARRFVASGDDVLAFAIGGHQQLFQRAQLREILVHIRDVDHPRFLRTVRELLERSDVRFHLKDAALALLAELDNPTIDEWSLVRDGIRDLDQAVAGRLRGVVAGRGEWFDCALSDGWLAAGLASDDAATAGEFVTIVGRAQRVRPAAVASLLAPFVGAGGDWPSRLAYVVRLADLTLDREFLDLVLLAIAAGDLDAVKPFAVNGTFWDEAYQLARAKPAWAAEFARAYLDREIARGGAGNERKALEEIPDPLDREFFTRIAEAAPEAYLDHVMPWILAVADVTTRPGAHKYDSFSSRWPGEPLKLEDALVAGADRALRALADADAGALDHWRRIFATANSETANYLLLRLGTAAPAEEGPDVAQFLINEPSRLHSATGSDYHWVAREFVVAASPSLSGEVSASLQTVILDYYPEWERTSRGQASRGEAQWKLLSAFSEAALTDGSRRRLRELRHKFGDGAPAPPVGITVSRIGSPIPDEVADRVTDEQWLGALRKHGSDEIAWDKPLERAGGVHQLAQTLFARTLADPRRFAALALRFVHDVPSRYMDDVLRGLQQTSVEVPLDEVLAVCARAHALPNHPCGRGIADVIGKRAHEELPQDALDLVSWYATNAADPASSSRPIGGDNLTEAYLIDSHALNCDRGRALLAIADLIRGKPSRLQSLRTAIENGASDRIDAVRAAAAQALLASLGQDRDFVVASLRRVLLDASDALLATRAVARLVSYFAQTDFAMWRDVLDRMSSSSDSQVLRLGASSAALASFRNPDAGALVNAALAGSEHERLGVADVAAANVTHEEFSEVAELWACTLFTDASSEVRREAATAVSSLPPESLGDHRELLRSFLASPSFDDNPGLFFRHLAESATVPADLQLDACERYVQSAKGAAGDLRTAAAASAGDVSRIAVRVHDQGDAKIREKALDIIDELLKVAAYGIGEAIEKYER